MKKDFNLPIVEAIGHTRLNILYKMVWDHDINPCTIKDVTYKFTK